VDCSELATVQLQEQQATIQFPIQFPVYWYCWLCWPCNFKNQNGKCYAVGGFL